MSTSTRHDPVVVAEPYRGIYAHGVETPPGMLYVSGQLGESPGGRLPADFDSQCRYAIANVRLYCSRLA